MRKFNMIVIAGSLMAALASSASDEVVVPVPNNLRQFGNLVVAGQPGAGQSETFDIFRCQAGSDGEPVKFGCSKLKEGKFNESILLSPGIYRVKYSGMISRTVKVNNVETSYLALKKLVVPKVDGSYMFKVFRDLTHREEQLRLVRESWSDIKHQATYSSYCFDKINQDHSLCIGWSKDDISSFRKAYLFRENGAYGIYMLNGGTLSEVNRVYVTDPKDGDFISVFPGVYGVEFTNREGVSQDVYGVEVR